MSPSGEEKAVFTLQDAHKGDRSTRLASHGVRSWLRGHGELRGGCDYERNAERCSLTVEVPAPPESLKNQLLFCLLSVSPPLLLWAPVSWSHHWLGKTFPTTLKISQCSQSVMFMWRASSRPGSAGHSPFWTREEEGRAPQSPESAHSFHPQTARRT